MNKKLVIFLIFTGFIFLLKLNFTIIRNVKKEYISTTNSQILKDLLLFNDEPSSNREKILDDIGKIGREIVTLREKDFLELFSITGEKLQESIDIASTKTNSDKRLLYIKILNNLTKLLNLHDVYNEYAVNNLRISNDKKIGVLFMVLLVKKYGINGPNVRPERLSDSEGDKGEEEAIYLTEIATRIAIDSIFKGISIGNENLTYIYENLVDKIDENNLRLIYRKIREIEY